jgi:hypothetical protein
MNAVPYSDDINRGYEVVKKHLLDLNLWNRIVNKKELDPIRDHHIFFDHYGGVEFTLHVKQIQSKWSIVYTRRDLFNLLTETPVSNQVLWGISYDDLLNILFSVFEELIKEENKLLAQAIRESEYRKAAKKMHYDFDEN